MKCSAIFRFFLLVIGKMVRYMRSILDLKITRYRFQVYGEKFLAGCLHYYSIQARSYLVIMKRIQSRSDALRAGIDLKYFIG